MNTQELIVDSFAGGGGASEGIRRALGRSPDLCINHDPSAIAMHQANHPESQHFVENVWKVDPRKVCRCPITGKPRRVWLFWCSPDCRHFSRAKGSKPVSPRVRGLAHVAVRWAETVRPWVIVLENVREFREWGPLIRKLNADGTDATDIHGNPVLVPDPARKGQSFKRYVGRLRNLGYQVEWRDLDAADFGAPTHRKRLFLVARRDGVGITWPEATHGNKPGLLPYRTAAECIDWSLPCHSIFMGKRDARKLGLKRPLARNTLKRIAAGFIEEVLKKADPYIVTCNHGGKGFRGQSVREPFKTITKARDAHALIAPLLVRCAHGEKGRRGRGAQPLGSPLPTLTASKDFALCSPYLVRIGQTGGNGKNVRGARRPLSTITRKAEHMCIAPVLAPMYGKSKGVSLSKPSPTSSRCNHHMMTAAYLIHMNHGAKQWTSLRQPQRTIVSNSKARLITAFLIKYYGTGGSRGVHFPVDTITSKARFGLVLVIHGEHYLVVDICMRMLTDRELALCQGFDRSYKLIGTKTDNIAKIGNSVPPQLAEAVVRANCCAPARKAVSA